MITYLPSFFYSHKSDQSDSERLEVFPDNHKVITPVNTSNYTC